METHTDMLQHKTAFYDIISTTPRDNIKPTLTLNTIILRMSQMLVRSVHLTLISSSGQVEDTERIGTSCAYVTA